MPVENAGADRARREFENSRVLGADMLLGCCDVAFERLLAEAMLPARVARADTIKSADEEADLALAVDAGGGTTPSGSTASRLKLQLPKFAFGSIERLPMPSSLDCPVRTEADSGASPA